MTFLIQISVGCYNNNNGLPIGFAIVTQIIDINPPDLCQVIQETTQKMIEKMREKMREHWVEEKGDQVNLPYLIKPDAISITKL